MNKVRDGLLVFFSSVDFQHSSRFNLLDIASLSNLLNESDEPFEPFQTGNSSKNLRIKDL